MWENSQTRFQMLYSEMKYYEIEVHKNMVKCMSHSLKDK